MKKILLIILTIVISINLFGCKESKEVAAYEFEYKFKEEYSDKISPGIAAAFIDITKDVVEIYNTALDDFEIKEIEEDFNSYATKVYLEYYEREEQLNEDEKELLSIMEGLAFNPDTLYLLKQYYKKDEINKSMGIKTEYTDEYYSESFEAAKEWLENDLENAKKFID